MEWPCSTLEEEPCYGLSPPHLEIQNKSSQWTCEANIVFENCLAEIDPASPDFFQKDASKIPSKSIQQIKNHYQPVVEDDGMIGLGNFLILDYSNHDSVDEKEMEAKKEEGSPSEVTKMMKNGVKRGTRVRWTDEEHQLFLRGLSIHGKGKWKKISEDYVKSKSPKQVASHAQKYHLRETCSTPENRRRRSIHDIRTVNPPTTFSTPSLPQINHGNSTLSINPMLNQSFNGGIQVQQNPNFNLPMNPNFSTVEVPIFNQSGSVDFTTSLLVHSPVPQNLNFNLPMNPNFSTAEDPIFNQSGYMDFTTSFLVHSPGNQQWT